MANSDTHSPGDRIKSFFGEHAAHYRVSPSHRAGPDLDALVEKLDPRPGDRCLDVATGGGHLAVALARHSRFVVALDLTEAMAKESRTSATAAGVENVHPVVADVHALPFRRESFERSAVRRAPHHFADPRGAVTEMSRVLVPGGRFGVSDMTVLDHPEAAKLANALEVARDSSHARALGPEEWEILAGATGLHILHTETMTERVAWETWLAPVNPGGKEEESARKHLEDADPEVRPLAVEDTPDGLIYLKRRIVLVARKPQPSSLKKLLDRLPVWLMVLALGVTAGVLVLRVLTHHPFYDECLHARMLWLLSEGLEPHVDYWCNYPVLGYVLTLPLFRAFPESAWVLLVLRFFTLIPTVAAGVLIAFHARARAGNWIWGAAPFALLALFPPFGRFLAEYSIDHFAALAAAAAMVLFFRKPRPIAVGSAAALCCLSFLLTPKYALPLFFGMLGMAANAVFVSRRVLPTLAALGAGAGSAIVVAGALCGLAGASLWTNLRYAHVFMSSYKVFVHGGESTVSLLEAVISSLFRNIPLLLLCVAGLIGFALHYRGRVALRPWAPLGILLGTLLSVLFVGTFLMQYVFPVALCLALFVPFALPVLTRTKAAPVATFALATVVLAVAVTSFGATAKEFDKTPVNLRDEHGPAAGKLRLFEAEPAVKMLKYFQRLLDLIPADERVVAAGQHHPLFRRDLTFITHDERPSFATALDPGDPAFPHFDVSRFRNELNRNPPAYIGLPGLEVNYPSGWLEECRRFLKWNGERYTDLLGNESLYLRKDLVR